MWFGKNATLCQIFLGVGPRILGTTQLGPKVRAGELGMGQGAKAKEAGLAAQLPSSLA